MVQFFRSSQVSSRVNLFVDPNVVEHELGMPYLLPCDSENHCDKIVIELNQKDWNR